MVRVIFYEKPGCKNNTKQKTLIAAAGHELETYNLLTYSWTTEKLGLFFEKLPVAEWFNRTAPRVKSGEIIPEKLDAKAALALMVEDPILIRRPLIQVEERREVGFDPQTVDNWIGLTPKDDTLKQMSATLLKQDLQNCSHKHKH
ncbi:MAG: ArsC/Spx/MgsR family protein [Cyanobacteria bacterium P01_A01_bin.45]